MGEVRERKRREARHTAVPRAAAADQGAMLLLDGRGEVLHVSPVGRSLLGARASDLVGQLLVRLVVWSDRPAVIAWLSGSRTDGIMFGLQKRGGTLGSVIGIGGPLPLLAGDPIEVRLLAADAGEQIVDSRLAAETLRAEVAELTRRNEELFTFAFSAAHDLRAPLMSISAAAQGLSRTAGVDLSEPAQALLGQLLHGIATMSSMVDASLRCARGRLGAVLRERGLR